MKSSLKSLYFNVFGGILLIVLLIFVLAGWAANTELSGAVIADGVITAKEDSNNVQHLEGGIVSKINVRDGDYVEKGQILLQLDRTKIVARLHVIEGQQVEQIIEMARLESERDNKEILIVPDFSFQYVEPDMLARTLSGQKKLLNSRQETRNKKKNQLRKQVAQTQSAIAGLKARLESGQKQLEFADEELVILKTLGEKGLAARSRIVPMQREVIRLKGQIGEVKADIARLRTKVSEIELLILEIEEQWQSNVLSRIAELRLNIANLNQQRLFEQSLLHRTNIVAPISGFIHDMQVHTVNGVINPGQNLMTVVPAGDQFLVRARVRPMDVDEIHSGQSVRLHFASLNRLMPEINGEVAVIGADQSIDPKTNRPYFRVDIILKSDGLGKHHFELLKLGMPVQAHITTQNRTVMDYLIKPFSDQLMNTFRET